jgi:hypothetical protein
MGLLSIFRGAPLPALAPFQLPVFFAFSAFSAFLLAHCCI